MMNLEDCVDHAIAKWLPILGLSYWEVKWSYSDDEEQETMASVWCSPNTRTADIKVKRDWDADIDVESVIVHELVHVMLSPISRSIDVIFDNHNVSNDTIDLYNNVEEQVIDQISKTLWGLKRGEIDG